LPKQFNLKLNSVQRKAVTISTPNYQHFVTPVFRSVCLCLLTPIVICLNMPHMSVCQLHFKDVARFLFALSDNNILFITANN